MNFIVTGGCGFIGSHLVEALTYLGQNVLVVDDLRNGKNIIKNDPNVSYIFDDVVDVVPQVDSRIHGIFHFANTPRIRYAMKRPKETLKNNINPTIHVAEWSRKYNCPLYFATSSSTIYSDKLSNPYTLGKSIGEDILSMYKSLYNLNYHLLYFYNVYGPREADYGEHSTVIRCFKNAIETGNPLRVFGSGKKTRDFTHVHDVVDGLVTLIKTKRRPVHVHLGTGNPCSIQDVAEAFSHPIVHEFDRPGEAQDTICKNPYVKSNHDVIDYIKSWKKEYDEAKDYVGLFN